MKNIVTPVILLCSLVSTAQITPNSQWTWMKGSTQFVPVASGQYGIQGVAAATNNPGARSKSVSWKDNAGNLWIFGGYGLATPFDNGQGDLNDLWKYDPVINMWTWMKGDSIRGSLGVYGVKGIAAVTNKPRCRYGSVSWKDVAGNLWMFGGQYFSSQIGFLSLNDLWKYNPSTNMWTWMKGDSTVNAGSIYGTLGIEADSVKPTASYGSVSWADGTGFLWLYVGLDASGSYPANLWRYNPATNRWAWIMGRGLNPRYGTRGVPDSANTPGSRYYAASWIDNSGNMWLFGSNSRSDLWKYNPGINQWTWIKGDTIINVPPKFGTRGISAPANHPGSRLGSVCWKDTLGKFWLYGGAALPNGNILNDLWKYDLSTNEWAWIKGDSTGGLGVYGVQGTPAATNKPPGKQHAVSWIDESGTPWIFGGFNTIPGSPNGSDLWKLSNVTGPSNVHLCNNNSPFSTYTLTAAATGSSYQWQVNMGSGFVNLSNGGSYNGVNTISLQLSNMVSSFSGYKYRCVVDGVVDSNLFKLAFTATWTGGTGGAWENGANWSCGAVPDANFDIFINAGSPVINYSTSCRSVFLKPSTLLTVKSGVVLNLTGK
ncbi:MAG: kelch repeat-containing protein [Chitinophagaceae bacterium]